MKNRGMQNISKKELSPLQLEARALSSRQSQNRSNLGNIVCATLVVIKEKVTQLKVSSIIFPKLWFDNNLQFRVSQSSIFSFHLVELARLCNLQELIESYKQNKEMWSSRKASFEDVFPDDYERIQLLETNLLFKKMNHEIERETLGNQKLGLENVAAG